MNREAPPAPAALLAASDLRTLVPALARATPRQLEVAWCMAEGHTRAKIAANYQMSESTVEKHLRAIFDQLGVDCAHAATTIIHHAIEAHLLAEQARQQSELSAALAELARLSTQLAQLQQQRKKNR